MDFELVSDYKPSGDQPQAIDALIRGLDAKKAHQCLLGVTGSGKTFTMANVIANQQRPTLVLAHNKTLAAQLCTEFRHFFPNNAVEYFISYYDYYQPEAYVAKRDLYIEKEADINEEIERLRHAATRALLTRRDVIIVASVSCIYGLGMPEDYLRGVITLKKGDELSRDALQLKLADTNYERHDFDLMRGRYSVKGETVLIHPPSEDRLIKIDFFGDEIDRISLVEPVSKALIESVEEALVFPATHYVVLEGMDAAIASIREELKCREAFFESENLLVEAKRIKQRTLFDLEMMQEVGYCKGIENYARHLSGQKPGQPPGVLLDFFPDDFLLVVDESHVTLPQVRGMYEGDRSRKMALVEHGFRLPSALDNRPLRFDEFSKKIDQVIYTSATPGGGEMEACGADLDKGRLWHGANIVEQIIRPTGLLDPLVDVYPTEGQIELFLAEIKPVIEKGQRILVTTLTKKMAEDVANFLSNKGIKVRYLHSDITALDRVDILHELRSGVIDVLVGVNLLREGLDLPEVSLVAIFGADKEGFLRNERSMIQTMGRAARNVDGRVMMFADKMTGSMKRAIDETVRRRQKQEDYNTKHGIVPKTVVRDLESSLREARKLSGAKKEVGDMNSKELKKELREATRLMKQAAQNLDFEEAAQYRDFMKELKEKIAIAQG